MAGRKKSGGGQRPQRVGEQIRQILSELMVSGGFKLPELAKADLVSFTEVRVTPDLRSARVFTSIFPSEPDVVEAVMKGLIEAQPRIRSMVGQEMSIRHTPELTFTHDESIERGARMEALIKEVRDADAELARSRGEGDEEAEAE